MLFSYIPYVSRIMVVVTMSCVILQPLSASWWNASSNANSQQINTFTERAIWFGLGGLVVGGTSILYTMWSTKRLKQQIKPLIATVESQLTTVKSQSIVLGKDTLIDRYCVRKRWQKSNEENRKSLIKRLRAEIDAAKTTSQGAESESIAVQGAESIRVKDARWLYELRRAELRNLPSVSDKEVEENLKLLEEVCSKLNREHI